MKQYIRHEYYDNIKQQRCKTTSFICILVCIIFLFSSRWIYRSVETYKSGDIYWSGDIVEIVTSDPDSNSLSISNSRQNEKAGLYTPFGITTGGENRYFLTVALAYQRMGYDIDILVSDQNVCNSMAILQATADALRVPLDLNNVRIIRIFDPPRTLPPQFKYVVFFAMGNSKFPPIDGVGTRLNAWMCQFPFDLYSTYAKSTRVQQSLSTYDITLVNSVYSQFWYTRYINSTIATFLDTGRSFPDLNILYPPVIPFDVVVGSPQRQYGENTTLDIVVLGRFSCGRQSKGHDVALDIIEEVMKRSRRRVHLSMIGMVHSNTESFRYVEELKHDATRRKLPVTFVENASPKQISMILSEATVMWHLTGMKNDDNANDTASKEHFGIAVVEAMSAGCIPIVSDIGGPKEIVTNGRTGFLASTIRDYIEHTVELAHSSEEKLREMSSNALVRSKDFTVDRFVDRLTTLSRRSMLSKTFRNFAVATAPRLRVPVIVMPNSTKYSAVIAETGINPTFEFCVSHTMRFLGSDWTLQVFHSERNEHYIRYALKHLKGVIFHLLPPKMTTIPDYNHFMKSLKFWEPLHAEKVLLFQTDSLMLNHGIKHFMKYDYVGAPWDVSNWFVTKQISEGRMKEPVGNGGFSLRTARVMIQIIQQFGANSSYDEPEDVFFSRHVSILGYKLPNATIAYRFSLESYINGMESFTKHLALHAAWYYIPEQNVKEYLAIFTENIAPYLDQSP